MKKTITVFFGLVVLLVLLSCNLANNIDMADTAPEGMTLPNGMLLTADEVRQLNGLKDQAMAIINAYRDGEGRVPEESRVALKGDLQKLIMENMGPGYEDLAGTKEIVDRASNKYCIGYYDDGYGTHPVYVGADLGYDWTFWWCQSFIDMYFWYKPAAASKGQYFEPDFLQIKIVDDVTNKTMSRTVTAYDVVYKNWQKHAGNWGPFGQPITALDVWVLENVEKVFSACVEGNDKWWSSKINHARFTVAVKKANFTGCTFSVGW
ncbi:MAG: hypothetical protein JW969_19355 [Spirochaetales bacterium]|nr:hypothetical protein [Spirochaetales bacterium]